MLESLVNPTLPVAIVIARYTGDNAMGAGDQQGRPDESICHYVAGFVDGEGSFHIAVQRNPSTKLGWQVVPEFHISQHYASVNVLETIKNTMQCGYLKPNHANSHDNTWVYVVRARRDLVDKIVPFFERYELHTT